MQTIAPPGTDRGEEARKLIFQITVLLVCEVLNALALNGLIVHGKLLSGGVLGASMLVGQLTNIPIGLLTIVLNIPIFYLGYRQLGRRFLFLSILGVLSLSIMLDNIQLPVVTRDLALIAVFGGVLTGIADGIILKIGGSTGGFDILGLIIAKRFGVSLGQVFLVFNGVIIALSAIFNSLELAMYTLIMQYVASTVVDAIQEPASRRVILIISTRYEEITARILTDLRRGVTYLDGSGAYLSTPLRVALCVVTRYELIQVRELVAEIDPGAFTVVMDAAEVIGRFDRKVATSLLGRLLR